MDGGADIQLPRAYSKSLDCLRTICTGTRRPRAILLTETEPMVIARHDITSGTAPRMSRCIVNGDMVYLAGLTAADRSADIKGQTQQILDAMRQMPSQATPVDHDCPPLGCLSTDALVGRLSTALSTLGSGRSALLALRSRPTKKDRSLDQSWWMRPASVAHPAARRVSSYGLL